MKRPISRRRFLQASAAGTAVLTMPHFLAACSRKGGAVTTPQPASSNPFRDWFSVDEEVVRRVLSELTARGADDAEAYFEYAQGSRIELEDGIISQATSSVDMGVGLRCVVGDRVGFAFTEDLTEEAMLAAARTAASMAQSSALTPPESFKYVGPGSFYRAEVPWEEVGIDQKLPLLERCEELAKLGDPSVSKVSAWWADTEERVLVAHMSGEVSVDVRPMTRLWVDVTATKDGETHSLYSNLAGRHSLGWYTEEKLKQVTSEAVDRTMRLFGARRPPAGEMPVILSAGASGVLLHEAIGHGLEADANRTGESIYANKLGKRIAPDFVTIVDDATMPYERGSLNVDDEGNSGERTVLVRDGILESYMHDAISARHYKVKSTGSGRRESFRFAPMPRMRCTYMLDGPHSRDEVIAAVDKGIIAETFTGGAVDTGAGDFTFYIKNGWLVEGGKITAPIKDVNIIGNGPEALTRVTMAANDSRLDSGGWTCGKGYPRQRVPVSQGLPTLLVSKMIVGGENA